MSNQKVGVYLDIENSEKNNLGMPLPKGIVRVYKADKSGRQAVHRRGPHRPHAARREGARQDGRGLRRRGRPQADVVEGARLLHERERAGRSRSATTRTRPSTVEDVEPIGGDWEVLERVHRTHKKDAFTFTFDGEGARQRRDQDHVPRARALVLRRRAMRNQKCRPEPRRAEQNRERRVSSTRAAERAFGLGHEQITISGSETGVDEHRRGRRRLRFRSTRDARRRSVGARGRANLLQPLGAFDSGPRELRERRPQESFKRRRTQGSQHHRLQPELRAGARGARSRRSGPAAVALEFRDVAAQHPARDRGDQEPHGRGRAQRARAELSLRPAHAADAAGEVRGQEGPRLSLQREARQRGAPSTPRFYRWPAARPCSRSTARSPTTSRGASPSRACPTT